MKKGLFLTSLFFLNALFIFAQISFTEVGTETNYGINGRSYGLSLADFDGDGDDDVYIARHKGALNQSQVLLKCRANGTFVDVTEEVGLTFIGTANQGVWGDIDNDGDLDLYVICRDDTNILYRNDGGIFTDITETAGVGAYLRNSKASMFVDVNNDGFVDIYVANLYTDNELWINNGDETFSDECNLRGTNDNQIAMGSLFFDYDNDGDQDLYLVHDGNQAYILLENDGAGYFTDVSAASNTDYEGQGMGVDVADINNDGWMDIYITNLSDNTLLLNNGDKTYTDISDVSQTTDPGMGWGTTFLDIDNDGLRDIYMANDSYFSPNPNKLYHNNGDNTFDNIAEGTVLESFFGGYGVACSDFNNDGKVDIFLVNSGDNDANQLFRNDTENENNYIKIKAVGTVSNAAAIGARIEIIANGQLYADEITSGMSYQASSSLVAHFGIGTADMIENLKVYFPGGEVMEYNDLEANRTYIVTEGQAIATNVLSLTEETAEWSIAPTLVNTKTTIRLNMKSADSANLAVFDILGKKIKTIYKGTLPAGSTNLELNTEGWNKGVYFVKLEVNNRMSVRKVVKG